MTGWDNYDEISTCLAANLTASDLSKRPGPSGTSLTYLEGWKVVRKANEIFGFDGWTTEVRNLEVDYCDELNGRWSCGVSALIRVTLKTGSYHDDVGYGTGEHQKTKGSALSLAKKEAVTDGVKRALRFFGSALGNSIYDKEHIKDVWKPPQGLSFKTETPVVVQSREVPVIEHSNDPFPVKQEVVEEVKQQVPPSNLFETPIVPKKRHIGGLVKGLKKTPPVT
ncbi:hypothetical protein RCL1_006188 [Eukaryota sp. TZLM3-RCL]